MSDNQSQSLLPMLVDTLGDGIVLILLLPVFGILLLIGPGLFIWFSNPDMVGACLMFYNLPCYLLIYAVYRDPENNGLIGLLVFQMVTAYLGLLIVCAP